MGRRLELGTLHRSRASRAAFAILDTLQNEPLEYMAAALGLTLQTLTEVKGLSPSEIMTTADNMLKTEGLADDNYVAALRLFIQEEVPS